MRLLIVAMLVVAMPASAAPGDWTVTRDPFDRAVIARYKQLLARDPHDPGLRALVTLYRRYRTVELLVAEYAELLARDDGPTLVIAARIARLAGDDDQALALFTRASVARSNDAQTWLVLGELHRAGGRIADARVAYQHVIDLAPLRSLVVIARTAAAELATTAGDAVAIDTHYQALLALDPKDVRMWTARGEALLATRPETALASFHEAERLTTDRVRRIELISRQGAVHAKLGRYHAAISEVRRALSWTPKGSGLTNELVRQLVDHARSGRLLHELRPILERGWPAAGRGVLEWTTLGDLDVELGSPDLALAAFEAAITLAPLDPALHRRAIASLDRLGRQREGTDRFVALTQRFSSDAPLHLDLAKRLWKLGERERPIQILTQLAARRPRDLGTQVAIADQFIHWQQPSHAVAPYERATKLDPEYLGSLALALAQALDREGLVALAAAQRDATGIAKVANVMLDNAMWTSARMAFAAAIALAPDRGELYTGRAGAHEGLEQFDAAANDAARALILATTTDLHRLRVLRHTLVRAALRTGDREQRWAGWREQLAREPGHRDLAALLADFDESAQLSAAVRVPMLEAIAARVPGDPGVRLELAKALPELDRYAEAIAILEQLAKLPGQRGEIAAEIRIVRAAWAKRAGDVEWQRQALRVGVLEPLPDRHDAANQKLRPGARIGVGTGAGIRTLSFGLIATLQLGSGDLGGVARLDWSEGATDDGHVRVAGGSAGLVTRLATTPNALIAAGGSVRVEHRSGAVTAPVGVAFEGTLDLTSRWTPFGLGLRLGHYLGGGTAARLDFVVEWR